MIDVVHEISSVERRVGSRTLPAGQARTVTITRSFRAPIDDVWDAVTSAERIPRWFLPISGELRPGGHYQLEGNAGGVVERCEPPRSFAATWEYGGDVSWIEVSLTEASGKTRLELVHIASVDDTRWAEYGPGAVGIGWDMGIMGLAQHLEAGEGALTPADGMTWMVSDEGKQFMTSSSEKWCEANIAAGEEPEAARAAAARTTAAYTGAPAS